jgi:type III pantothenate kinase
MIVVDIGNTNIVIGIYSTKRLKNIIRLSTKEKKLLRKLDQYFKLEKIVNLKLDYKNCIISSVASTSTKDIVYFFTKLKFKILKINVKNIPQKIKFKYKLNQLGADRIANTFAAINKFKSNVLVIDFGTATTFDVVIENKYEGGLIAPGIDTSHDSLVKSASKLRRIKIIKTKKLIGKNTKSSMQSGFYWGYASMINGIINKIIMEKNIRPKIVLTGGLAKIFKDEIKHETYYEPYLTLEGLYLIGILKYA